MSILKPFRNTSVWEQAWQWTHKNLLSSWIWWAKWMADHKPTRWMPTESPSDWIKTVSQKAKELFPGLCFCHLSILVWKKKKILVYSVNGKGSDKQDRTSPVGTELLKAWKQEWELVMTGTFKYFLTKVHMKIWK